MHYTIRTEQPRDFKTVENLTREAFWNVYRPGCTEHYVLHCYRSEPDFVPELSLVLEVGGEIIGHVMYAWSHIDADDGRKIRMMTFGPISIRPDYKRKGYGKSGFVVASTRGIRYADDPESDAPYFLCKELQEGFLNGITGSYRDPEPYFVAMRNPEAFEKYDSEFPPKEKLVLPRQLG